VGNDQGSLSVENQFISLEDMVDGPVKAIGVRQHGLGVDLLRGWVAGHDGLPELAYPTD
jgi:hypothetical protein